MKRPKLVFLGIYHQIGRSMNNKFMSEKRSENSNSYIPLYITNETDKLEAVVLGIGSDLGEELDINPTSKWHMEHGTYPNEADIMREIATLESALKSQDVEVFRPKNIPGIEQIFTRDIGFVIDDFYVMGSMQEDVRQLELPGVAHVTSRISPEKILTPPKEASIEGGDVILWNEHIFVGISARTNWEGYEFIKASFPNRKVHAIPLFVSDDRTKNILHLDCTFQPIGQNEAIIYENGFLEKPEIIYDLFEENNLIKVNQDQMMRMFPNIFSVAPDTIIIDQTFTELIEELEKRGYKTLKVEYRENSKLSGLLRCSTLPLRRAKSSK